MECNNEQSGLAIVGIVSSGVLLVIVLSIGMAYAMEKLSDWLDYQHYRRNRYVR